LLLELWELAAFAIRTVVAAGVVQYAIAIPNHLDQLEPLPRRRQAYRNALLEFPPTRFYQTAPGQSPRLDAY